MAPFGGEILQNRNLTGLRHRTLIVLTPIENPVRNIDNIKQLGLEKALGYKNVYKSSK